ncbi:MAG: class I SAM-dependent methyltransferase [Candidatus Bathyarchaeia archaeon]|jgi:ubiquinone/menaquinone biosynthesis C-methylase UbiE
MSPHSCHGGFALDEAKRRSWYNPDAVLGNLKESMIFVDVGCGDGYFSLLAAKKVGSKGKVYAVDVDAAGVEKLQKKADAQGLTNIVAAVGRAEDTVFCKGCADMVFFSMDLHDFEDQAKVLQNAKEMLKPRGQLVDLDWKKMSWEQQGAQVGPPMQIRFSEEKVRALLSATGFKVESVAEAGPYHYLIVAKPS